MDELDILQKALSDAPSVSQIARDAKVAVRTANAVKTSENPGIRTAIKLARAAGLEFYIGPPRDSQDLNPALDNSEITPILGLPPEASADEILAAITALAERAEQADGDEERWVQVQAELAALRTEMRAALSRAGISDGQAEAKEPTATYHAGAGLNDPAALAEGATKDDDPGPATRLVGVVELRAAAGDGTEVLDEKVIGHLSFRRQWLDRHAIDPTQCMMIGVRGESMEPLLPDGGSILVDRSRRRRLSGHVYVLRTDDGVVVKRLARGDDGQWQVLSDHPAWPPQPWDDTNEIIGEVRWAAQIVP